MRVALVLPGQGSQRPGAGAAWRDSPGWAVVEQAGRVLDRDVAGLLLTADAETLRSTANAQLATFVTSLVALASVPELDVVAVTGHSLGEFTALVAAGVLSLEDGLRVVDARGRAMQRAADLEPGTMAAVLGAEPEAVADALPEGVWAANDNAPKHVVVSGRVAALAAAQAPLKAAGARRVLALPVGGAFHTPLMAPARAELDRVLAEVGWQRPRLPVLSSTRVAALGEDPAAELSAQLTAPVRWRETVLALPPVDLVLEVGPGSVLTGLVARILAPRDDTTVVRALSVAVPEDLEQL